MIQSALRFFYNTVSAVLHPLVYPTIAAILLFTTDEYFSLFESNAKLFIIAVIAVLTYLAPLLTMPLLYMFGAIKSVTLVNKRERTFPLLVTGLFFYTAYFVLKKYQAVLFLNMFLLSSAISILVAIFVSFRWKISLHMIGAGGFLAYLVMQTIILHKDVFLMFCIFLLFSGILGTSRLALQAHSLRQISAGFFTGFLIVFLVFSIVF